MGKETAKFLGLMNQMTDCAMLGYLPSVPMFKIAHYSMTNKYHGEHVNCIANMLHCRAKEPKVEK